MKERILTGWNFQRILFLVLGGIILFTAIPSLDWISIAFGGHGGLFLGFRHADFYGACGSMSGGVDIRPFKKNWELSQKLGDTLNHWDNWNKYSVINVIEAPLKQKPVVIIDCGTEDFFYTVNRNLHNKMLDLKIPHDYIERPGAHNWEYWKNSIQYQLMFFSNYFSTKK